MSYAVFLTAEAERNREQAYLFYLERSLQGAHRWFAAYEKTIDKLIDDPERFAIARESEDFPTKLQQINFGTRVSRPTHRMLFYIEDQTVVVVTLRHLMQDIWNPGETSD